MKALAALIRETKIKFYEWAQHDMSPLHPDLPKVVRRLHELKSQRPPVDTRPRSRCKQSPGMCAADSKCPDTNCRGRIYGLHHTDGGHEFRDGVAWPIEKKRTGASA